MTKLCLMPKTINELNLNFDAIMVGYKNFNSLNVLEVDIEEIKKLRQTSNKELYISFNQLIHDDKINEVENILKELSLLNIDGLLYDDLGVLQIVKENNLQATFNN